MHYGFDEDEESFRLELRRWAEKVLAPHYQADDRAATFRRQQAVDMARIGLTGLRIPDGYGGQGASAVAAGIGRSPFDDLGSRAIGRASVHFDDVPVTRDQLVGAEGGGFVSVMQGFDYSRAVIGLLCLGAAQQSLDEALQWARDRKAFGQPIGRYQGVAFPLATHVKGARHVCYEALWRKDSDLEHSAEAAMAKLWAPKLAAEVIHQCLLTLGHVGYSTEHKVGQRLRDVIGLEIGDGTAQVSKMVISRELLGRAYAP